MTVAAFRRELWDAIGSVWPSVPRGGMLPFAEFWSGTEKWLAFHAPHVGLELMRRLIDEAVATCLKAERDGSVPVAPVVPEAVRTIWAAETPPPRAGACSVGEEAGAAGGTDGAMPRTPCAAAAGWGAPFGGLKISALRRARRQMVQGVLGSW